MNENKITKRMAYLNSRRTKPYKKRRRPMTAREKKGDMEELDRLQKLLGQFVYVSKMPQRNSKGKFTGFKTYPPAIRVYPEQVKDGEGDGHQTEQPKYEAGEMNFKGGKPKLPKRRAGFTRTNIAQRRELNAVKRNKAKRERQRQRRLRA